jgi:CheY-like chemotaxis protein
MTNPPVILVIEDDRYNYEFLEIVLQSIGAKLFWAQTANTGLQFFKDERIDLVLMDIKLPDKNGYELTREFKEINSSIPIIAQTAYALSGDRERAMEAGCDAYISKPIRKDKLITMINELLSSNK